MIGPVLPEHHREILASNEHFVHWLAPLDAQGLKDLLAASPYSRQIGGGAGVLIAMTSDCAYQSDNLTWLREKFDRFVYIDRVIISEHAHGKGYGRTLYEDLEGFARATNYPRLVCEVNTKPDNPGSHAFHARMGFVPCGEMDMRGGAKRVRYYEKPIS